MDFHVLNVKTELQRQRSIKMKLGTCDVHEKITKYQIYLIFNSAFHKLHILPS